MLSPGGSSHTKTPFFVFCSLARDSRYASSEFASTNLIPFFLPPVLPPGCFIKTDTILPWAIRRYAVTRENGSWSIRSQRVRLPEVFSSKSFELDICPLFSVIKLNCRYYRIVDKHLWSRSYFSSVRSISTYLITSDHIGTNRTISERQNNANNLHLTASRLVSLAISSTNCPAIDLRAS